MRAGRDAEEWRRECEQSVDGVPLQGTEEVFVRRDKSQAFCLGYDGTPRWGERMRSLERSS